MDQGGYDASLADWMNGLEKHLFLSGKINERTG